jgi:anti-sigma regulatory factor (Ser/Thr protein kinase)
VSSSIPHWITLHLRPHPQALEQVVCFVRHSLAKLPNELCQNLTLVLHELLENAFEHGCGFDPSKYVEFTYIRVERMVLFQIRDFGPGFSLGSIGHTALNNPPDQPFRHVEYRYTNGMRPGGYGIVVAKRIADELIYNEQGNEVLMIKRL